MLYYKFLIQYEVTFLELNRTNSPFDENQLELIQQLMPTLSSNQQSWLSGYLLNASTDEGDPLQYTDHPEPSEHSNATAESTSSIHTTTAEAPTEDTSHSTISTDEPIEVNILFGTETGNAEEIADEFETKLKEHDFTVHTWEMDDFPQEDLSKVNHVFIITSTHGVGEPPINALDFYDYLHSDEAPDLSHLNFSVLALGDQDYPDFCQAGKDFDKILGDLGGHRLADRVECDFDFEEVSEQWIIDMLELLSQMSPGSQNNEPKDEDVVVEEPQAAYSKTHPFYAEIIKNSVLTEPTATREVRHLELSLEGYGEAYEPGDSLVIIPKNNPELVAEVINTLSWDSTTTIDIDNSGNSATIQDALTNEFEIAKLTPSILNNAAALFGNPMLNANVQNKEWVQDYIYGRDFIDLIKDFTPVALSPDMLKDLLRKLPPREYSIASSNQVNPHTVHITVRVVKYEAHHRERHGVCSVQLADRTQLGDKLPVYLKKNPNFKFPYDEQTPVIMIGAGTGIAPYRAYLQQREHLGLKGNQWLIFGNQNVDADFLYRNDLELWLDQGVLSKLDLAFSRDTENKIYVQHRIEENGADFYQWLTNGATIYLCGDKEEMAKGVHQSFVNVLIQHGNFNQAQAEDYLTELIKNQRYQRDVY